MGRATEAQRASIRECYGRTVKPTDRERDLDQAMKGLTPHTDGGISTKDMEALADVECLEQAVCPSCALLRSVLYVPGHKPAWFRCCGGKA